MKLLFWKERRELRFAGPLAALLALLIAVVLTISDNMRTQHPWQVDAPLLLISAVFVSLFGATVIGAGLVAPEVGGGTLQFLSSLPVRRRTIWSVKLLAGVYGVICCLVGTVAGYVVAIGLINLLADTHFVWRSFLPLFDGEFIAIYSASLIGGFSVGALASPLFDRTTGATTAAVLLLICIGGMVGALWTPSSELLQSSGRWLSATAIWIAIIYLASAVLLSLLRGSYRAFTRGETLKTGWRFLEALLGTSEVVWWMLAFPMVAFLWFIW